MNDFLDCLKTKFLEIYADEDISTFDLGRLLDYNEDWLFLHDIDKYGNYDGYLLIRRDSIHKINYDTAYIKNLHLDNLIENYTQIFKSNNFLEEMINKVIENKNLISITLSNGDTIVGIITKDIDNYLLIDVYMDNGLQDGSSIILKETISCIQFEINAYKTIQKNIQNRLKHSFNS